MKRYSIFSSSTAAGAVRRDQDRIASPAKIRSWSFGEVKKPETINYRTFKPERDGLFCAKIFARSRLRVPVRQVQAAEAPWRHLRECGVEVTLARCGASGWATSSWPADGAHLVLKSLPSRMGMVLDMTLRDIERVCTSRPTA